MTTQSITRHCITCPRCHGQDVTRSRTRSVLERAARFLGLRPFRCTDCYERFFSFGDAARRRQRSAAAWPERERRDPRGESADPRQV